MSTLKTYQHIERVKNQIIDTSLILGTILGVATYILSLNSIKLEGFNISFISNALVLIILVLLTSFRKRISLRIKSFVILGAVYLLFLFDTINLGIFSANKVLLILIPFAALMSLSLMRVIQISIFILLTFIILAYLHLSGYLTYPPQDNVTLSAWLINIILISVVAIVIILIHIKFNYAYSVLISNLEYSNKIISEKERNYREIFNSSTDAIFIHDLEGDILDVNDSMLKMYCYERTDLTSLSVSELSSQADGYKYNDVKLYFDKVNAGQPQVFDWQAKKKNDEFFWVEVSLKKTKIGENDRILGIVRDINQKKEDTLQLNLYRNHLEELVDTRTEELKKVNEELNTTLDNLKETQTQLIGTEKMASLGVLAAGVAHEINNPINYIYNGAAAIEQQLIESNFEDTKEIKVYLDAINLGVLRITDIVKSLGKYSRNDKSPFSNCNVHEVINNCLVMLHNQYKNRIEIAKHYSDEILIAFANEGNLHQAFLNVLTNAVQAIETTGSISIKSQIINNAISITIADNGKGISVENQSLIFDPFFTTKAPGEGTGLGLAITKTIIENHNGSITCSSVLNQGTTFTIILPINSNTYE